MSLIKQLWIGIVAILLIAFGGSCFISMLSAKTYLTEQLQVKNMDNATSLALSMSQMEKELVSLELFISAQFDSGHYEYIVLTNNQKKVIVSRRFDTQNSAINNAEIPQWFMNLIDVEIAPGVAQVQDGWQQFGTLTLKSQSHYAWLSLWQSTKTLLLWFTLAALVCGIFGTLFLKYIIRPLDFVIEQAEAIGERRFMVSKEPRTLEFKRLVKAMNALSLSVKNILEKDTQQLEKLRKKNQLDPLTELPNRHHFLNMLESHLINRNDSDSHGIVIMLRLSNLAELNNLQGREGTDHTLLHLAKVLHQFTERHTNSQAGRLNSSDFIVMLPGRTSSEALGEHLASQLRQELDNYNFASLQLPIATSPYAAGTTCNQLLHKLDGALATAELKGNRIIINLPENEIIAHRNLTDWRLAISHALQEHKLHLADFPVRLASGELLHSEAPARLKLDGDWQPAGYFMPWAARIGMLPAIDLEVIQAALINATKSTQIAINISANALCNAAFRQDSLAILSLYRENASNIWIEFPESCALRHMAELRGFTHALQQLGCKVGLEHVGIEFTKIRELQDVGLNYLKIDSAIVRTIENNQGNQDFLQGLTHIAHALGMLIIAEGVTTESEKESLIKLQIDGLTGPAI